MAKTNYIDSSRIRVKYKECCVYAYPDKTMATASFRTLSPNTRAYRVTSTFKSLKIAKTVTEKKTTIFHND